VRTNQRETLPTTRLPFADAGITTRICFSSANAGMALFAGARPGPLEFNPLAVRAHGDIYTARNTWLAGQFRAMVAGTNV
jgi:hypothetical protein